MALFNHEDVSYVCKWQVSAVAAVINYVFALPSWPAWLPGSLLLQWPLSFARCSASWQIIYDTKPRVVCYNRRDTTNNRQSGSFMSDLRTSTMNKLYNSLEVLTDEASKYNNQWYMRENTKTANYRFAKPRWIHLEGFQSNKHVNGCVDTMHHTSNCWLLMVQTIQPPLKSQRGHHCNNKVSRAV